MITADNVMPDSVLLILAFLVWVTTKIIFVLFENIVIDHIIKKEHIIRGSIFRKLKYSFKYDGSEIMATIFQAVVGAFGFIAMLAVCSHYCDAEVCNYICDHLLFFSFFDITITMVLLVTLNYLKKYGLKYVLVCKPMFNVDKVKPEVIEFMKRLEDIKEGK